MGERTYGDAAIRKAIQMDDGSAVILSVAKYYSPDGKSIQDNGVTPGTLQAEADADWPGDGRRRERYASGQRPTASAPAKAVRPVL